MLYMIINKLKTNMRIQKHFDYPTLHLLQMGPIWKYNGIHYFFIRVYI